ncbi:hypothetical protein DL93DRAFT_2083872 [Clavulina sp. PMI_390]|nr:hypothetical protein DL93DRAFT_2083872 [Clavulina sp. PMI_390]
MASFTLPPQTSSFSQPDAAKALHDELAARFVGKPVTEPRTPALLIDCDVFASNCADMHKRAKSWNWGFRAHIKTHKTIEGTRLQLRSTEGTTDSIVASTIREARFIVENGLVADGTVKDILYGLPFAPNKLQDLAQLSDELAAHGGSLRIFVDSPDHVKALEAFNASASRSTPWSAFFKVDLGTTKRAGLVPGTDQFLALLKSMVASPAVSLHGFYSHAGTSYASTSLSDASDYLTAEIKAVLDASQIAQNYLAASQSASSPPRLTLSVGATPTAHAFSQQALTALQARLDAAQAQLELHAGNYPMLDLQQVATNLVPHASVSQRVLASVVSYYPGRGTGDAGEGSDEALIDAGGIAMSKDTGPIPGFGDLVHIHRNSAPASSSSSTHGLGTETTGWRIGRMSQEHGILVRIPGTEPQEIKVGDMVEVTGQHACYIAAAYPWYYVVEDGVVKDVWVPCKGW